MTTPLPTGLRVVTAPNPGPMTGPGTNTYLLGTRDVAVIDPGPDDAAHLAAILAAVPPGGQVTRIVVTHAHLDHSALAPALAARTGAPVLGFGDAAAGRSAQMQALPPLGGGEGVDRDFRPDATLADGAWLHGAGWSLRVLHTPGHMANHISLVWPQAGAIFTGDHVMGWTSTFVSPPDGDMADYMASLDRLEGEHAAPVYFPAHGDPVADGPARVAALRAHRRMREAEILAALRPGAATPQALTRAIYRDTPAALHGAAARNVLAHLVDLAARGLVAGTGADLATAAYRLTEPRR